MNKARSSLRTAGAVTLACAASLAAGTAAVAATGAPASATAAAAAVTGAPAAAAGEPAAAAGEPAAAAGTPAAAHGARQQRHHADRSQRHHVRVTVKVLGSAPHYKQLLSRTVTLTAGPVAKDGGSCSGYTAADALQLATKGRWSGAWNSEYADWEVTKIDGLKLAFNSKSSANWYWSFDVNGKEASAGVCDVKPKSGQTIVFKPACYGKSCPKVGKASRVIDAADRRRR